MKHLILLFLAVCAIPAQTGTTPVSREAQLELALIANQEQEAERRIAAVVELLRAPIERARQAVVERECKRAGIIETETETCQIDAQAGVVGRVSKPKKEERSK